jgi:hypothetical protein
MLSSLCCIILLGLTIAPMPASAQPATLESDSPPEILEPPPRPTSVDASTIPASKVSQFVRACVQVVQLIERREGELQAVETELESARIEQDIEAEALAIIEQAGLTKQEYLQLLSLANVDPEFGDRVAAQLQESTDE